MRKQTLGEHISLSFFMMSPGSRKSSVMRKATLGEVVALVDTLDQPSVAGANLSLSGPLFLVRLVLLILVVEALGTLVKSLCKWDDRSQVTCVDPCDGSADCDEALDDLQQFTLVEARGILFDLTKLYLDRLEVLLGLPLSRFHGSYDLSLVLANHLLDFRLQAAFTFISQGSHLGVNVGLCDSVNADISMRLTLEFNMGLGEEGGGSLVYLLD